MRKVIVITLILVSLMAVAVQAATEAIVVNNASLTVSITSSKSTKLEITKDGTSYYYDLKGTETFPLQMGAGTYTVRVLEHVVDKKFRVVSRQVVDANFDSQEPFLPSVQNVKWDPSDKAIALANEFGSRHSGMDLVEAIHTYVVENIDYDHAKINSLATGYIPNIEETYASNSGICYDYSALLAAMLRSQGVPAKLVMGYTSNAVGYHAWNEVYVNGDWIVIDSTYDAQMRAWGISYSINKDVNVYQAVKVY